MANKTPKYVRWQQALYDLAAAETKQMKRLAHMAKTMFEAGNILPQHAEYLLEKGKKQPKVLYSLMDQKPYVSQLPPKIRTRIKNCANNLMKDVTAQQRLQKVLTDLRKEK